MGSNTLEQRNDFIFYVFIYFMSIFTFLDRKINDVIDEDFHIKVGFLTKYTVCVVR